uniref:Uncharacterized protein n=1 Tax=Avena sativa TaxID=4498 RepID=A0ACD5WGY0_AVESA
MLEKWLVGRLWCWQQPELGLRFLNNQPKFGDSVELVLDGGFPRAGRQLVQSNIQARTTRPNVSATTRWKISTVPTTSIRPSSSSRVQGRDMRVSTKKKMTIWECMELLNEVVDDSDPDLDLPQIQRLLQTAEAIHKDHPNDDWLHLTRLIHDLGKMLLHPNFGELPQWAVVGDTFPVGCALDEDIVHYKVCHC